MATENGAPAEITIEDFSGLIAGASRLLTGLGRLKPFQEAEIGLAEWLALTTLGQADGISNQALARELGVTRQRANQICSSLSRDGLIAVKQSARDSRANEIKITDTGKTKIRTMNAHLTTVLSDALKGKERAVAGASRQIRQVVRVLRPAKHDRQGASRKPARKDRAGRLAARAARRAEATAE